MFGAIGTPLCFVGKPAGKAPNLVVLVHGCCTDFNAVINDWESFGKLIAGNIHTHAPEQWEVVVWDWSKDTPDSDFLGAYSKAKDRGHDFATAIMLHSYKYIHLIGHSAGSRLIQQAAKELANNYRNNKTSLLSILRFWMRLHLHRLSEIIRILVRMLMVF